MHEAENLAVDLALSDVLRGRHCSHLGDLDTNLTAILRRVEFHGIGSLVGQTALDCVPLNLRNELRQIAISSLFWEAQHLRKLRPVLEALEQCGAGPIIFKGTSLAYTRYAEPSTRTRGDTDILVRHQKFEEACRILCSFGFSAPISGLTVQSLGAKPFSLTDDHGFRHEIDLHQRINSSRLIARLFPHEELHRRSEPVPKIGFGARALASGDALLVACFHRLIHKQVPYYVDGETYLSSDRLIWLHDIKLLHDALTHQEKQRVVKLAKTKGLLAVLSDGLKAAHQWLDLGQNELLSQIKSPSRTELPYGYLSKRPLGRWILDLAATKHKGRAIVDVLIPPRAHMEEKFGARSLTTLTRTYFWRALNGLYKVTRRHG